MSELMYKIANEEAPDICIIRSELTPGLADLVALSLSKRPETRYQTGDQFAADLRSVMSQMSGSVAFASPAPVSIAKFADDATVAFSATLPSKNQNVIDSDATAPASMAEFEKTIVQRVKQPGDVN